MRHYWTCKRLYALAWRALGAKGDSPPSAFFHLGLPSATEDIRTSLAVGQWSFQIYHHLKNWQPWRRKRRALGSSFPPRDFGDALLSEGQAVARLLQIERGSLKLDASGNLIPPRTPAERSPESIEESRGLRWLMAWEASHPAPSETLSWDPAWVAPRPAEDYRLRAPPLSDAEPGLAGRPASAPR